MSEDKKELLTEEQLDNVAGGGATQNRWDSNICAKINDKNFKSEGERCRGFFIFSKWCDHYNREHYTVDWSRITKSPAQVDIYHHTCAKGYFDFYGDWLGEYE